MLKSKTAKLLFHAFIGWLLCAATMGIGMSLFRLETALVIHAIAAPIFFSGISAAFFKKNHFISPLKTAMIFVGFVIAMDFFVVALLINRSFDMFTSLLGTWIPFAFIFLSTYLTGLIVTGRQNER